MNTPIVSYAQSREYTCGAAALMVALHELGCSELSETQELRIWRDAHPRLYTGSLPAKLAKFAQRQGCAARLLVWRSRLDEFLRRCPFLWRLYYRYVLACERFAELSVAPDTCEAPSDVLRHLAKRPTARLLALVEVEGYELHYVLARICDGGLWVLDPACGSNQRFEPDELTLGHHLAGYFILIDRADGPATP